MGLGSAMAGGNPARMRQEGDRYPTPPDVTRALAGRYQHIGIYETWEPCAGDGAMLDVLRNMPRGTRVVGSDISPGREDIYRGDFLSCDPPDELSQWYRYGRVDAIITNPPFKHAAEMIERAASFRPIFLALLLKSTFWQAARRWPLFQRYRPTAIHPLLWRPDFLGLGAPTMDVSWVVWERMGEDRHNTIFEPMGRPS